MMNFNHPFKTVRLARGGRKPQKGSNPSHHGTHHNGWNNVARRSMMKANRVQSGR